MKGGLLPIVCEICGLRPQRRIREDLLAELFSVIVAFFGDFGFEKAALAAGFGFDLLGRKNEPI
jgi:hypothetical protein